MRRLLPLALALLLGAPGCATYVSIEVARHRREFPRPFCGVALHVELYDGVPTFDLQLLDLLGSFVLDVGLLPVTVPGSLVELVTERPKPLPNLGPAPAPGERQARRAQAEAAQALVHPRPPTFAELLAEARRVAPEDAALLARLAPGGTESILHTEEGQLALPDLTRMEIDQRLEVDPRDGVALAALGAAWARAGDLDRAAAYLRLGAALCKLPSNARLAEAELERVVARRAGR